MSPRLRACLGIALVAAGMSGLAVSGDLRLHAARFFICYGVAGAGFALLATAAASIPLRAAIIVALVLRVALLPSLPSLSSDAFRYIWDGKVQLAGIDPYRYAPRDHTLDRVGYAWRGRINHPSLRTIYPPLAEGTFAAVVAAGGGMTALKLVLGAFDLLTAAALWWLAPRARRAAAVSLWLLCPATILMTWGEAHLEIMWVPLVLLAAGMIARRRDAWAGVALGLAAALKVTPVALALPALLGGRARPLPFLAGMIPAMLLPYVPYAVAGGATGSLTDFGIHWTGNAPLLPPLAALLSYPAARALCALAFVAGAVLISTRLRGRAQTAQAFTWVATLLVLVLPAVQPWYWLGPLALALAVGAWTPVLLATIAPAGDLLFATWRAHRYVATIVTFSPLVLLPLAWARRGQGAPAWRRSARGKQSPTAPLPRLAEAGTPNEKDDT